MYPYYEDKMSLINIIVLLSLMNNILKMYLIL